jgi:hypothetical protein
MNADFFAQWFRRQGFQVTRTASSYWVNQGRRVYQAFPYHWLIQPEIQEIREFLRSRHALGLRYSTPLAGSEGCLSYHAVYEDESYDLEVLKKWARKNVRRGLRNCQVEPISFSRLAREGWALQVDTLKRQGRRVPMPFKTWERLCLAAADLPGFEAWGALVAGRLGASVISFKMEDCYYLLYQQCHSRYLNRHLNNALSFAVTQTLVQRQDHKSILYGLHSLDAPARVDEFKFRMGYAAKPVRQRVVFHPLLKALVNRASHALVRKFLKVAPGNPTLAKAEGLMRFYLEGRRPLKDQKPPAAIFPDRRPQITTPLDNVVLGKN